MLFLLRLAFWILVICLLLPGPPQDNRRLLSSAEQTVSDVRGFCGRNPQVCEDARITMTAMLTKLKNGAEIIQAWVKPDAAKGAAAGGMYAQQPAPEDGRSASDGLGEAPRVAPRWNDDLSPSDKEAPWRGPAPL